MYKSMATNLMVESVDKTIDFYCKMLGFSVIASVPSANGELQFAILAKDNLFLMFQERENLVNEYPILATPKTQPSATLYIKVDNFNELYNELKQKCEIIADIHTTFYGRNEFAIRDNNGYVLTFTEDN